MKTNMNLRSAREFRAKGLLEAARFVLENLLNQSDRKWECKEGVIYNELGLLNYYMGNYRQAADCFASAVEHATTRDSWVLYNVNLAIAYRHLSEYDTCYRILNRLKQECTDEVRSITKGLLFANLSTIQGLNGFYADAITSILESFRLFGESGVHGNDVGLHNNLGIAYLELGQYEKAELHLKKSLELSGRKDLPVLSDIGRLYLMMGKITESIEYTKRALDLVWSSIINYEKEEIARLCHLLANITIRCGEVELAVRLNEKAQVMFGQLGMWRQWQDIEAEMNLWHENPPSWSDSSGLNGISLQEVHRFLLCLDALHSQELIHKKFARLLDLRAHYVRLMANELELSDRERNDLVLASRFADYGLTALETEVVMEPGRSEQAFEKYKLHPTLSVQMSQTLGLSDDVIRVIEDHHERFDGSGYPHRKVAYDIHHLARILAVVDAYCTGIILEDKRHDIVWNEIIHESGKRFDPRVVETFIRMHDIS